jgi:glycosyltransferase involved in cell wall biosynthesis
VIAVSMLTLRPGRMGGSESYGRNLTRALAARGGGGLVCLVPHGADDAAGGLPSVVVDEADTRRGTPELFARLAIAGGSVRRRTGPLEGVHYPFTVPVPRLGAPAALTLHDLLHRDFPGLLPRRQRLFRAAAYDAAARRAAVVIVASEYVGGRAEELLRIPAERIRVIPHGIDHELFRPGLEEREDFLVYPARGWPHKNHGRLLRAFRLLRGERPDLRLVLPGGGLDLGDLPEGVSAPGFVAGDELATLYQRAAALVFPSLHEGFGQPPLEALASGCPVACSRTTSLPEVCGDAAVYFDPESPEDIAQGVLQALARAGELRPRGLARAAEFTWERSANAHADAYGELGTASA